MYKFHTFLYIVVYLLFVNVSNSFAQTLKNDLDELKKINVDEHLGKVLPLNVDVVNEQGQTVKLQSYFNGKTPVIFSLNYYECPMLCTQELNGIAKSINSLQWSSKNRFSVVTLSINPREGPDLAAKKQKTYLKTVKDSTLSWAFLTAKQASIDTIAKTLGFEYFYIPDRDQYAHPAVIFVLAPDGKITRYLYGISYDPKDMKLALLEAGQGKIGNTVDKILLYCYHYSSKEGKYTPFAENIMRLGGVVTMIVLFSGIGIFWYREKKKKSKNKLVHNH